MEAPDFAAVDTSVELAGAYKGTRPFKGLINAVLRGLARAGKPEQDPARLAPDWLLARWKAAFGVEAALKIAAMIAQEPSTDLTFKDPAAAEALAEAPGSPPYPRRLLAHRQGRRPDRMARLRGRRLVGAGRLGRHPGATAPHPARRDGPGPLRRPRRQDPASDLPPAPRRWPWTARPPAWSG